MDFLLERAGGGRVLVWMGGKRVLLCHCVRQEMLLFIPLEVTPTFSLPTSPSLPSSPLHTGHVIGAVLLVKMA